MDKAYEMVRQFHRAFSVPLAQEPQMLAPERAQRRCDWMREEIDEFLQAQDLYDQADAMIDLIYFALGTLAEMGVKPGEIFEIVHRANMAKLFKDGKPHYNAQSKVIKPPDWQDPKDELIRQIDLQRAQNPKKD